MKSQLSSQVSQPMTQNMQEVQRERDTIKADRSRLLAQVSQLERDVTRMEVIERQKSSAVSHLQPVAIAFQHKHYLCTVCHLFIFMHIPCVHEGIIHNCYSGNCRLTANVPIHVQTQSTPCVLNCKGTHCYMQDKDAQHARGMQEASGRAVHDLEVKATQLQTQLEQSQQALHAEKAQYGQQETLVQTEQHMDKLQRDLASERQKVNQLTGKSQEVAKAKQDVLQATKAVQVSKVNSQFTAFLTCKASHPPGSASHPLI